jgi:hypothetical protein
MDNGSVTQASADGVYVVSLNAWDSAEVRRALTSMGWWPRGLAKLLLVNDPLVCPPQGLLNLRAIKHKGLMNQVRDFVHGLESCTLEVVHPDDLDQVLAGQPNVHFHRPNGHA